MDLVFLRKWRKNIVLVSFFIIISLIALYPIFSRFSYWGIQDWDFDIAQYAIPKATLLEFRQFPLWNPFCSGGIPLLANPQSKFLSPFFLVMLFIDVFKGIKILIFFHLVIGLLGTYWLARYFKLDFFSSLLTSFIYMLNSSYFLVITVGMTTFMYLSYIPWIFLCLLKSFINLKYAVLSSLFLVLMFFGGGVQLLIITFVFLFIYTALLILFKKERITRILISMGMILFFTFTLGAVKFLPTIEVFLQFPRKVYFRSGYSLESLFYSLFNRDQTLAWAYGKISSHKLTFFSGINSAMDENGIYIGIIPFIIFLIGFLKSRKKQFLLGLSFLIFVWLSLGTLIPLRFLRLWSLLHRLPVIGSMRVPQRFHFIFMLLLAIICGFGFQAIQKFLCKIIKNKMFVNFILYGIIIFIFIDLFTVNYAVLQDAFIIPPSTINKNYQFQQIWQYRPLDRYILNPKYPNFSNILFVYEPWSSIYPDFLANYGTINARDPISFPEKAIPIASDQYRGEIYLKDNHGYANYASWSPNKLKINLEIEKSDYLVINQNYFPGWRIKNSNKQPIAFNGLLAVKVQPGDKEIELYYLPKSFIYGAVITSLSFMLVLYILILKAIL